MNESSLSRISQHLDSGQGFAILSAHVHDYLKKAIKIVVEGGRSNVVERIILRGERINKERHQSLKKDIRKLGYGYIEVDGNYTYEAMKIPDVNLIVDNMNVEEESLLVPGGGNLSLEEVHTFREDIIQLGKKYNQESVIVVYPKNIRDEIGGKIVRGIEIKNSDERNDLDWGSRIVPGKGAFGTSSLKKGSHGRERMTGDVEPEPSDLPDYYPQMRKKGETETNIDINNIKFPPNPKWKNIKRGKEWHTESLAKTILEKIKSIGS